MLDITYPCYHSPLRKSLLVSYCFALEAPIFEHKEVSEENYVLKAGAQAEDQETEGRSQEGVSVREQD